MQMYDSKRFTDAGFRHHELYFPDGSCPPDALTAKFLEIAEREPGELSACIAQHAQQAALHTTTLLPMSPRAGLHG